MARDPLTLVNEFRDHPDPRVRCNVVTALAAINSPASVKRLLEIAIQEKDADVGARAAESAARIARAGSQQEEAATAWFRDRLSVPERPRRPKKKDRPEDKAEQARLASEHNKAQADRHDELRKLGRASSLAARLRSLGFAPPRPQLELEGRVESAFWNRQAALEQRGRIGGRQLVSALVGTMFGGLVGVLALMALNPQPSIAVAAFLLPVSLILAPLLGSLVNDRSTPISSYHDPGVGALWELLIVGLWTFPAAVGVVAVFSLSWPGVAKLSWSLTAILLLLGGVAANMLFLVGLRIGVTIAVHTTGPEFFRTTVRTLCGFGVGFFLLTGSLKLLARIAAGGEAEGVLTPLAGLWLLLLSAGVGIAAAMATQYPQRPTTVGRWGVVGCRLLSAAIILAVLAPIVAFFSASDFGWPTAEPGKTRQLAATRFAGLPGATRFDLDFRQTVRIEARSENGDDDLVVCLAADNLEEPIPLDDEAETGQEIVEQELASGTYAAEARLYDAIYDEFEDEEEALCGTLPGQAETEDANLRPRHHFFAAARQLFAAGMKPAESETEQTGPYALQVTLNTEPARALQRQVQALAEDGEAPEAAALLAAVSAQGGELDLLSALDALCRAASLRGRARPVATSCGQLEDAPPDHPDWADFQDTLGIHYARLGEQAKAAEAFERFIGSTSVRSLAEMRRQWIELLRAQRDPFKEPRVVEAVKRADERFRLVGASNEERLELLITDGLRNLIVDTPERIELDAARRYFDLAVALEPAVEGQARYLLCSFGALSTSPETAVSLCNDDRPQLQLSHAIALARTGDRVGAIQRLERWQKYTGENQKREIAALEDEKGANPFDERYLLRRLTSMVRDLGDAQVTLRFWVNSLLGEAEKAGAEG